MSQTGRLAAARWETEHHAQALRQAMLAWDAPPAQPWAALELLDCVAACLDQLPSPAEPRRPG